MAGQKHDTVPHVGPLHFRGPAVERDAKIKEKNDNDSVNLTEWKANLKAQDETLSDAEVAFFTELRRRGS